MLKHKLILRQETSGENMFWKIINKNRKQRYMISLSFICGLVLLLDCSLFLLFNNNKDLHVQCLLVLEIVARDFLLADQKTE